MSSHELALVSKLALVVHNVAQTRPIVVWSDRGKVLAVKRGWAILNRQAELEATRIIHQVLKNLLGLNLILRILLLNLVLDPIQALQLRTCILIQHFGTILRRSFICGGSCSSCIRMLVLLINILLLILPVVLLRSHHCVLNFLLWLVVLQVIWHVAARLDTVSNLLQPVGHTTPQITPRLGIKRISACVVGTSQNLAGSVQLSLRTGLFVVVLPHLVQLRVNLLFLSNFGQHFLFLLRSFPILRLFHLLHQLVLVLFFVRFALVELLLSNIFKHIWGFHVGHLCLGRTVSFWGPKIASRKLANLIWSASHIHLLPFEGMVDVQRLAFNSAIMLRLAGERSMLADNFSLSVPNWRTTSLSECSNTIFVRIFTHELNFVPLFFLFLLLISLVFLLNLLLELLAILHLLTILSLLICFVVS